MIHASWCPAPPAALCPALYVVSRGDGWRCLICHHVVDDPLEMNRPATTSTAAPPPERPIEVGDYVRWERGPADPDYWIEGYIEDVTDDTVRICIVMRGPGSPIWMRSWVRLRVSGPNSCVVRRVPRPVAPERAPLHIHYDGAPLVELVDRFMTCQREIEGLCKLEFTNAQHAAVSTYWSAELRAMVAASDKERKTREVSVLCQGDYDDDEPWETR